MTEQAELDLAAFRTLLTAQRDELVHLAEVGAQTRSTGSLEQTDQGRLARMDAIQQQVMSLEAERRRQLELRRIAGALQRLEEGQYGYCVRCGGPIARKRLELDPAVPTCIGCASGGVA